MKNMQKSMEMNTEDKNDVMKFVCIGSFDNYINAHIAMGKLQEEYINCYLQDENTVTIDPFLSNAIGGIKLMVVEPQVPRALEIFNSRNK